MDLFSKVVISSLVYPCVCIEFCHSNATEGVSILTRVASVEARYFALHPPLSASKTVLSSWNLVLITTVVTGITACYDNRLVVPTIFEIIATYIFENIGYQSITCLLRIGITYEYANTCPL